MLDVHYENYATIFIGFQPLSIVAKLYIVNIYGGPRYASVKLCNMFSVQQWAVCNQKNFIQYA